MTEFDFHRRVSGAVARLRPHLVPSRGAGSPPEAPQSETGAVVAPAPGSPRWSLRTGMKTAAVRLLRPPLTRARRFFTHRLADQLEMLQRLATWLHEKTDAAHHKLDAILFRLQQAPDQAAFRALGSQLDAIERRLEALTRERAFVAAVLEKQATRLEELALVAAHGLTTNQTGLDEAVIAIRRDLLAQRTMIAKANDAVTADIAALASANLTAFQTEHAALRRTNEELYERVETRLAARIEADRRSARADIEELQANFAGVHAHVDRTLESANVAAARVLLPIDDNAVLVRMVDFYLLAPLKDVKLIALLADSGVAGVEPGTTALLRKLLAPGMTAIDLGAHIGMLTMNMARAVGAAGTVIACEPSPVTFPLLKRTIALNTFAANVTPYEVAIGSREESAKMNLSEVSGHSTLLPMEEGYPYATQQVSVSVRTLDSLLAKGASVQVIKMDIEGYELEALRGMKRVLAENPELAMIVEFGAAVKPAGRIDAGLWLEAFLTKGFDVHVIDERGGELRPCNAEFLAGIQSSCNLLMTRPGRLRARVGL